MNLQFFTTIIILFFVNLLVLAYFILGNILFYDEPSARFKKTKIFLIGNGIIQIFQAIIIFSLCLLMVIIPQFPGLSNELISLFYIPIILVIGIIFNNWLATLITLLLSVGIIIDYAIISSEQNIFFLNTIFQILTLLAVVANIFFITILKKNKSRFINFISSLVLFSLILIFATLLFYKNLNLLFLMLIQILVLFILYLIMYEISLWFIQFTKKISSIDKKQSYEHKYFLNSQVAFSSIQKYIDNNNINFGVVILFNLINFNRLHTVFGNSGAKFIQQEFLQKLVNSFSSTLSPLFFMTDNNEFACFIPLKQFTNNLKHIYSGNNKQIRSFDDPLRLIQDNMFNIPKIVNYKNHSQQINSGAYASIYGLHSCDLNQLLDLCIKTKQKSYSNKKNSILEVYNPSMIYLNEQEIDIKEVNNYFLPNNFQITCELKKDVIEYYDFHISYLDKLLLNYDEIINLAIKENIYEYTSRLIAMQSLKKYSLLESRYRKKYPVIINYPLNFTLSHNFNLGELKIKLQTLNIDNSNIIFSFDLSELNDEVIEPFNLINMKNVGFKILFKNLSFEKMNVFKKITPDYVQFVDGFNQLNENIKNDIYVFLKEMEINVIK